MLTRTDPLTDLAELRFAADDLESAYLVRTRLRRLLLNVARDIARRENLPAPEMPGVYEVAADAPLQVRQLAALVSDIYQRSDRMCQPSESLDARWRADWGELTALLDTLEQTLSAPRS